MGGRGRKATHPVRAQLPSLRQLEEALSKDGVEPGSIAYAAVEEAFYFSPQERTALVLLAVTDDGGDHNGAELLREESQKLCDRFEQRRRRAATEIQRRARGMAGRHKALLVVDHAAATVLQCVYRMLTAKYAAAQIRRRQAAARLGSAATAIQRTWRGLLGRRRGSSRREVLWEEFEHENATLLQRAWLRRQAVHAGAARAVQAGWRGREGRRRAERRRTEFAAERTERSVRLLQRCSRGWAARRRRFILERARTAQRAQAGSVLAAVLMGASPRRWWLQLLERREAATSAGAARQLQMVS